MWRSSDTTDELYRLPPFVDAHMHFMKAGRPASREELGEIKGSYKKFGILGVNDMGHKSFIGLEAKKVLGEEMAIRSALCALSGKGGYGAFLGKDVAGTEEIRKTIKEISDAGADFLKVINSGIVSPEGKRLVTGGGFSREELEVICTEAKERDLDIACHANSDRAVKEAAAAGVSSIEHGFFVSKETLHAMAEGGVSWTPTAFALQSLAATFRSAEKKYIEEVVENHLSSISYASSIGVKLSVGTDSGSKGVYHGDSFFEELRLFLKAGLSFEEIASAACMGKEEREKGNFVVVKKDFILSRSIEAVYIGGTQLISF